MNTIEEIIAYIRAQIYSNGTQRITGNYLQDVLVNVADALEQIHTDDIGTLQRAIEAVSAAKAALNGSSSEDFAAKVMHAFQVISDTSVTGKEVIGETVAGDKLQLHNADNNALTDIVPGGQSEDIEVAMPKKSGTLSLQEDVDEAVSQLGQEVGLLKFTDMVNSGDIVIGQGSIGASGNNITSAIRLRIKDAIPTSMSEISVPDGFIIQAVFYYSAWMDSTHYTYINSVSVGAQSVKLDTTKNFARLVFRNDENNNIVPEDLISALFLTAPKIDALGQEVENQRLYLDGLQGLKFNSSEAHQLAKQAIKAIWLTYGAAPSSQRGLVDALRESLANTKLYIQDLYNVAGTYGCFMSIYSATSGGDLCFSKFVAGIHTITGDEEVWNLSTRQNTLVWPSGSGITGYPFELHIAVDWNLLNNIRITTVGDNPIELNFGELHWGERVDSISLKEKVQELDEQQRAIASIDLAGKKIVCFGDSLTEMTVNTKHYSDYISERTGVTTINIGFGGTQLRQRRAMAADFDALPESTEAEIAEKLRYAYATIDIINLVKAIVANDFTEQTKAVNWLANHGDDNTAILARVKAIDWTLVDGVTIFAGTNDWASNTPVLGQSGGTDVNYTLGAINEIIRLLLSTFKQLKIYWFTPIVRWTDYSGGTGTDGGWGDVKNYNATDGNLKQFANAIENEVRLNHIPVCDLYNTLGWNKSNFSEYFPNNDGTHPQKIAGVTYLAKRIGAFILANNAL